MKALLDSGADIRITDNLGWTLVKAASHNGHVKVIKLLLKEGADITIPNNNGWTRVNATSISVAGNDGATPICPASNTGHVEVVKLLLEMGQTARLRTRMDGHRSMQHHPMDTSSRRGSC